MSNTVKILQVLKEFPGLDDDELAEKAGVWPRNQVNQICKNLEREGRVRRLKNNGKIQNFLSDPFVSDSKLFHWTRFYEAIASNLLRFRNQRESLIKEIYEISSRVSAMANLKDQYSDGIIGQLKDICPFTVMGTFNRGITDKNRIIIARELANLLDVSEPVPESFEGIPVINNQNSWFFGYAKDRKPDDIDALWDTFSKGIIFADSNYSDGESEYINAYDNATKRKGVGWNLTMGLYWARPWKFPTLDNRSQKFIETKLGVEIKRNGPKGRCSANDYLDVLRALINYFKNENSAVHSFPELSLKAFEMDSSKKNLGESSVDDTDLDLQENEPNPNTFVEDFKTSVTTYSLNDIVEDGCFLERNTLDRMLERLMTKKNLILQGPPGTGKTWLSRRLAYALLGKKEDHNILSIQFHPNLSYEDFVRGYRPSKDKSLQLVDGPFLRMIQIAKNDPREKFVVVIEEINRGNPAQIFGEMLTLLEADKRNMESALELSSQRFNNERVFIPENLFVIGTMNIADRSLALVDFALRRRFAFINLEPNLGDRWSDWMTSKVGIAREILDEIKKRLSELNIEISNDKNLGSQFCIGHSYVTPTGDIAQDPKRWFQQVVETEIGPLLEEYWFDDLTKARLSKEKLRKGF